MTAEIIPFNSELAERATDEPALVVDVEGFEGPLDLLLTLARQQKVDLAKISILALADQYLIFIERARTLFERANAMAEKAYGSGHPALAPGWDNLGALLCDVGRFDEARPYVERAVALYEDALGPHHPDTTVARARLALLDELGGQVERAGTTLGQCLASAEHDLRQSLIGLHGAERFARAEKALCQEGDSMV